MSELLGRICIDPNDPETLTYDLQGLAAVLAQSVAVEPDAGLSDYESYQHGQIIMLKEIHAGIGVLGKLAMGNVTKLGEAS